ncbi:MAG: methionine--tRNA ligase subunit beta, partial [Asgard group archaeon]|nr:methionine--tRNA ligase subunit beta [Asgard group archaeon]
HRTLTFVNKYFNGKIPKRTTLTKADKTILKAIKEAYEDADKQMRKLEFQRTILRLMEFARECNKYFQFKKPWMEIRKEDFESAGTTINICVQCCRALAILFAPFIPFSSEKVYEYLNLTTNVHEEKWSSVTKKPLSGRSIISNPQPIFTKIELEEIIAHARKWGGDSVKEILKKHPELKKTEQKTKKKPKKKETKEKIAMSKISFNEFQKLDIRVGTIKKAERIEGTDKLLKLQVDIGSETRQIVAGIAEKYEVDELIGTQIALIVNLEPAKIRGVESNGMLLAADAEPEISILTPIREVPNGSKIR